jgi:hypothetical protein
MHCRQTRPIWPHMAPCLKCHRAGTFTLFGFRTRHLDDGGAPPGESILYLNFCIIRDLTGLSDLTSPSWTEHSFNSSIPSQIRPFAWRHWLEEWYHKKVQWLEIEGMNTIPGALNVAARAHPIQRRRGRILTFFSKICKNETSGQDPEGQALETVEKDQLAGKKHQTSARKLQLAGPKSTTKPQTPYKMPVAECEIDRCCITWNGVNRANRTETWAASE